MGAEILLRISREFVKSVEWLLTGGKTMNARHARATVVTAKARDDRCS
jgi:hypothetical protein